MRNCFTTREKAKSVWATFLDVLYPRTCVACGRYLRNRFPVYLCSPCLHGIDWIGDSYCEVCGAPFPASNLSIRTCPACRDLPPEYDRCRSLFMYRGIGARLLHALKYEGATWLRPQIEAFVLQSMVARDHLCGCVLVPIPLHWWKLSRRGYNQADIIAAAICNVIPDCRIQHCLRRRQHTTSQTMLSKSERLQNMAGVFQACKIEGASPRFMLVDDVLTTGATLNSAAHAMREAGALRISAFTLAHG